MKNSILLLILIFIFSSCNEDYLDENPEDFLSSANAFTTYDDFLASVNNLYFLVRRQYYSRDEERPFDFLYGTDLVYDGEPRNSDRHSFMEAAYNPASSIPTVHWNLYYKTIAETNTIIDRSESSQMTEDEKARVLAEARFFRGFTYRALAYVYGGVPLVTSEVVEPKVDFARASKEEVLSQAAADLEFAAQNLPGITETTEGGRINALTANHFLAEVYLALGRNTDAIAALNKVINDPETSLMQERFGSRSDETPGDVYWDLFRRENQNRSGGNKEAIWVIQFDLDTQGGGLVSTGRGGSYMLERHHAPLNRLGAFTSWPVSDYTGGRGIGWMISSDFFSNTVWGGDASNPDFVNDIRNANHNFMRVYNSENTIALDPGETYSTEDSDKIREFYAYQTKVTTPFNHPSGLYRNDDGGLTSNAGGTYTDQYMLRLAESYLLRAEAHLANNSPGMAAADINIIRERANASLATAEEMDIDYILDERVRELGLEEKRRLTLMRLGLLVDRVKRFNPYYVESGLQDHMNLWPIPANEIEGNRGAVLEQNPGYPQ